MAAPISLQLYAVRDMMAEDFVGTLKKVAEIGYVGIEPCGYYDKSAAEFGKIVSDLGLKVSADFISMPTKESLPSVIENCAALGTKTIIAEFEEGQLDTEDQVKVAAGWIEELTGLLKPHGMKVCLHNHDWEFRYRIGNTYPYDLLAQFSPSVLFELDVYQIAFVGGDPAAEVHKHRSRLPMLHAKDGTLEKVDLQTAVGSGALDMPAILVATDPKVLEWVTVDMEFCATDMMGAVAESYRYLTSKGLAVGNN